MFVGDNTAGVTLDVVPVRLGRLHVGHEVDASPHRAVDAALIGALSGHLLDCGRAHVVGVHAAEACVDVVPGGEARLVEGHQVDALVVGTEDATAVGLIGAD